MRTPRAAVALLALALALPWVGCTPARQSAPTTSAPTTSAPTAQPAPSRPTPGSAEAQHKDLEFTGPPKIAYVDGRTLIRPGGGRLRLAANDPGRWRVSSIVAHDGGYLVTDDRWFEGTVGMHRLDDRGRVVDSWTSTGPAVRGPDGRVAWISLVLPESGETGPTLLHVDAGTQRLDPDGNPSALAWAAGRWAYFAWGRRGRDVRGRWWSTDLDGPPRQIRMPRPAPLVGPDGRHRMTVAANPPRLIVRDENAQVVTRVRLPRRWVFSALPEILWEDDAHLLATVVGADARRVIARVGLAGEVSRASEWQPARRGSYPFLTP